MTRGLLAGLMLLGGGAGIYAYTQLGAGDGPPAETRRVSLDVDLTVGVAPAVREDSYERRRLYTGTIVAARRSVLSFELQGKIVELAVDEGDAVVAEQPLARLDTTRVEARLAQAEADLAESRATLDELEFGPRLETIAAARAEVRSLEAQRDVAERNLKRRAKLVETRAVSREEYDEALFDFRADEARVDVAQKALDELLAGTRRERVAAQAARVEALAARVADLRHELDDANLKAPYAGRIAVRRRDEGAVVAAGEPVLELVEDSALEAWIGLPPKAAGKLSVGETLSVTVGDRDYAAAVRSIRAELDTETRTRNTVLAIDDSAGLVAGQVVRVGIGQVIQEAGYWVPNDSLQPRERGLWAVYVVGSDGVAASRDVELLEVDGRRAFVRGTLQAGEAVVVEGAHRVVAGQRVVAKPIVSPAGDGRVAFTPGSPR